MPAEVKHIITEITPRTFFPIRREHPELIARFVSGVTKVEVPEKNKTTQVA
jgi:hypothetical protein